jgi:probable phosphomutase (TIGR03848 family)
MLPGRAPGLHLADEGRVQADTVASRIAGLRDRRGKHQVEAVYASPLERASETAEPIGTQLGLPVRIEAGLLECDFGEWTGAELKALAKLPEWKRMQRWPSGWRFPGGESFTEMQTRMLGCVGTLCARHRGGTLVAVSHADPIKAAVAHALGSHLDLFQRIVVSPCSVSAVAYGDSGPTVLAVNATASLGELRAS